MASGADPEQPHPLARVDGDEGRPAQLRLEPVEAPAGALVLVDQEVVGADRAKGASRRTGPAVVEPGVAQADGVVRNQLGAGVVVGERVDRRHHPVAAAGQPIQPQDGRIGRDAPGDVGPLALRAGHDVERRLADHVRQRALAVALVEIDEGRQRECQRGEHHAGEDHGRGGHALPGELPTRLEAARGHHREGAQHRHDEAHLQRGQRRCPQREIADAEERRQDERARRPAQQRERQQNQEGHADAAAEGRAVHGHVPGQREEGAEAVAVAELVVEGLLRRVGLCRPHPRVGAEHAVGVREDRVAGLELRLHEPGEGRHQGGGAEGGAGEHATDGSGARDEHDQDGQRGEGDRGERLGGEPEPGEQRGDHQRRAGPIAGVADHPAQRERDEERRAELDVGCRRLPGDRWRHGHDRRGEQRDATGADLRTEPVGREHEQHTEAEVDELRRDLVAEREPVAEHQLRAHRIVRDVLAGEVEQRPVGQVALDQIEVVPERVVLHLGGERPDQREAAGRRHQRGRRPLDHAGGRARAPRQPARGPRQRERHAGDGHRDQRSRLEQMHRGQREGDRVERRYAGAEREQELLERPSGSGGEAAPPAQPDQGRPVAPRRQEDGGGRGQAAEPPDRRAAEREVGQRAVEECADTRAAGGPDVHQRQRQRPRRQEQRGGRAAAPWTCDRLHRLAPPSSRSLPRSTGVPA